ncbi:MAG TPA: M3 family metallopeptidase [Kineosporiaceae bacterium]|nr:M3 family metallopeptidase [Kineosporiaceae bacterium]
MSLPGDNPFAVRSTLEYGLPPFDLIREEHYLPAFEEGMAEQRRELEVIAGDPAAPSLQNTLEALERSGALLSRVSQVFFNLISSNVTDGMRAVEAAVVPQLAAHQDALLMDPRLFARVTGLVERREELGLDGEQRRLLERYHLDMIRAGAALAQPQQVRLREINQELSTLGTIFRNNLQADSNDLAVHVKSADELAGLPDDVIAAAADAAAARELDGYLITLILPSSQPALSALTDRGLRERLHRAAVSRGRRGNEHDTRAALTRIVALRVERATLLGYPTHAAYIVADQTAGSVESVMSLLTALVEPAVENAKAEQRELTARLHADGYQGELQPWDWPYYEELVAQERFARDTTALRPWFELSRVVQQGVFAAATGLFGLTFVPRPDLPGYHPDVQVFEVFDNPEGEQPVPLGLFLADWYARDSKRGGAWMSSFVDQSELLAEKPVIVINLNLPRPPDGTDTLLNLDQVRTAFHEFGHVLHGLLSKVRYPRLSGTNVPRDFVEYPSQVNEMWAWEPELLADYAVHHRTGEPLSRSVLDGLLAAQSSGQGFATTEILAAMLLDQAWHQRTADQPSIEPDDVERFEAETLEGFGLALPAVPPRYGSSYFAHIFSSGYSAGYYSYLWSEVLDADTEEWFQERGGLQRRSGEIFRRELLSRGGSVDPMVAYQAVLGRPPRIEPLLERRGLTPVE